MSKSTKSKKAKAEKKSKEETTGGVDGAEKKPVEEKPKASDENARPPLADAVVVGRGRKLDPTKVRDIRARLAKGEKAADIAAVYDLHPSSVDDIRVGRTWSSVV